VFDAKVTETITANLTMAQARIKDSAVKTGESEKTSRVFYLLVKHAAEYFSFYSTWGTSNLLA
jgi:hypothetical protein